MLGQLTQVPQQIDSVFNQGSVCEHRTKGEKNECDQTGFLHAKRGRIQARRSYRGEQKMKLYLVHCGYYDQAIADGVYEQHTNFFVAAESPEQARTKAKSIEAFKSRRMHVDGLQEINAVDGFQINLAPATEGQGYQSVTTYNFRDLAPKPPTNPA